LIQSGDDIIPPAGDEQCRRLDVLQCSPGQIGRPLRDTTAGITGPNAAAPVLAPK
jgi:hypothetical protein